MSKPISITVEHLSNRNVRATVRHDGATVAWKDGIDGKATLMEVMASACFAHQRADGTFDLTQFDINPAALELLA